MGSLLLHAMTMLAYGLHIGGGAIALVSGTAAMVAPKGGRLHRMAGTVFFASMLVMAAFAAWLAVAVPGQIANLVGAVFTAYLVATAWITIRRPERAAGLAEKIALAVSLCLCAPFAWLIFQVATGAAPEVRGPHLIATYSVAVVIAIAAITDAKVVLAGGISGAPRIARHLWRMGLALTAATGSAFTNGFARLLPGHYHVPMVFFLPLFLPLILLIFWMIRVRFTGWFGRHAAAGSA